MKPVCYSYIRFSSAKQADGDSLRRQTLASEQWAERNGYSLDTSLNLHDLGVSAFRGANAAIGQLGGFLKAIESGHVKPGSVLIVESLDRLSRDKLVAATHMVTGILLKGISIVQLHPETVLTADSDTGQIMLVVVELARANSESLMKSQRGKANWKNKKANAPRKIMTRKCPGWLQVVEGQFQVKKQEAAAVRKLFRLYLDGVGIFRIVQTLNREKFPTLMGGKQWHKSTVRKLLCSRTVLGEYQPGTGGGWGKSKPDGDPVEGYYPPIVSEADFAKVQNLLASHKNKRRGRIGLYSNLFTGLLIGPDGSQFQRIDKGTGKGVWLVPTLAVGGITPWVSFPYDEFEEQFLKYLTEVKASDLEGKKGGELQDKIAVITHEMQRKQDRMAELKERLKGRGEIDPLLEAIQELENEIVQHETEIERIKGELTAASYVAFQDTQSLATLLRKGGEPIRAKLKLKISEVIQRIDCVMIASGMVRTATLTIQFSNGTVRRLAISVLKRKGKEDITTLSSLPYDASKPPGTVELTGNIQGVEYTLTETVR